jgi:hypothetical protein
MRKISEYRQHAKECRLGEAIEISRAPADASEHGRHMGIARQRSYQDRRRPGANCQVGKSRREEP